MRYVPFVAIPTLLAHTAMAAAPCFSRTELSNGHFAWRDNGKVLCLDSSASSRCLSIGGVDLTEGPTTSPPRTIGGFNTARTFRSTVLRAAAPSNNWIDGGIGVCDASGAACKTVNLVDLKAEDCGPWSYPDVDGYHHAPSPAPAHPDKCQFPSEEFDTDVSPDGRYLLVHRNEAIESSRQWVELYDVATNKRVTRRKIKDLWADRDRVYGIVLKWLGTQAIIGNADRVFQFDPLGKGILVAPAVPFALCETCGADNIVPTAPGKFALPRDYGSGVLLFDARTNVGKEIAIGGLPVTSRMHPQLKLHVDGDRLFVAYESPSRLIADLPAWDGRVVAIDLKRQKVSWETNAQCKATLSDPDAVRLSDAATRVHLRD